MRHRCIEKAHACTVHVSSPFLRWNGHVKFEGPLWPKLKEITANNPQDGLPSTNKNYQEIRGGQNRVIQEPGTRNLKLSVTRIPEVQYKHKK